MSIVSVVPNAVDAEQAAQMADINAQREFLLAELKKVTDDFEKARIEQRLWETFVGPEKESTTRRAVLAKLTGAPTSNIEHRGALFAAGSAAQPLWERVRSGHLTLHKAARLLSDARWIVRSEHVTEALGVIRALQRYDEAPTFRGHKQKLVRPSMRDARITNVKTSKRKPQFSNTPLAEANRFWASLREQCAEFVRSRAGGADEIVIERLITEMMTDLKALTQTWSNKIGRATNAESSAQVIRRAQVIAACRTLSVDPPKPGKAIDLNTANTRKKMLARAYHPDTSGTEATSERYQAVLDAYAVLEDYAAQFGAKGRTS